MTSDDGRWVTVEHEGETYEVRRFTGGEITAMLNGHLPPDPYSELVRKVDPPDEHGGRPLLRLESTGDIYTIEDGMWTVVAVETVEELPPVEQYADRDGGAP